MCLYWRDVLPHAESIQRYLQDSYLADVAGHGIVKSVHVEAEWPGDPVEETKCVCPSVCLSVCLSVSQVHAKDWLCGLPTGSQVVDGACMMIMHNIRENTSRQSQGLLRQFSNLWMPSSVSHP